MANVKTKLNKGWGAITELGWFVFILATIGDGDKGITHVSASCTVHTHTHHDAQLPYISARLMKDYYPPLNIIS